MTTLDSGITDLPPCRKRPVVLAIAVSATAVAGFVGTSLALKSVAHLALESAGLAEDAYGQCVEYILVTALSMFLVRKLLDLGGLKYDGRLIFAIFSTISGLVMAFAVSSGVMKVDFLVSLLQMSVLCLSAYLQFWRRRDYSERGKSG